MLVDPGAPTKLRRSSGNGLHCGPQMQDAGDTLGVAFAVPPGTAFIAAIVGRTIPCWTPGCFAVPPGTAFIAAVEVVATLGNV